MKTLLITVLFSFSALAYDRNQNDYTVNDYSSCVSWCQTKSTIKNCFLLNKNERTECKEEKVKEYRFCELQCRDLYKQ